MADYKQSNIEGVAWTRCNEVRCFNPLDSGKLVTFSEERIMQVDGSAMQKQLPVLVEPLSADNILEAFDLVNPETGEKIGDCNFQSVYVMLHSLYLHRALKRDADQASNPAVTLPEA